MKEPEVRKEMLERYIKKLAKSFGGVRGLVRSKELRALHAEQDYIGMIRFIRKTLKLGGLSIKVNFVNNKGGPFPASTPAWVIFPRPMPLSGTPAFRKAVVTIYIRKKFLQESTCEAITIVIAHELSHIVLYAIGHELAHKEEAVDLTAMLLGYRDFYRKGCVYRIEGISAGRLLWYEIAYWLRSVLPHVFRKLPTGFMQVCYLSLEEIAFAADIMEEMERTQ